MRASSARARQCSGSPSKDWPVMPTPICETVIVIAYSATRECAWLRLDLMEVWSRVMDNPTAGRVAHTNSRKSRRSVADYLVISGVPTLWVGNLGAIEVEHEKPKGR